MTFRTNHANLRFADAVAVVSTANSNISGSNTKLVALSVINRSTSPRLTNKTSCTPHFSTHEKARLYREYNVFFQLGKNSCRDLTMKKTKVFQLHLDDLFSMARRRNWGETRLHSDAIAAPPSLYKPGNSALSPFAKKGFHWLTLQHAQPDFIKFPPFLASNGCPTLVKSNIFGRLLTLRHLGFFGSRIRFCGMIMSLFGGLASPQFCARFGPGKSRDIIILSIKIPHVVTKTGLISGQTNEWRFSVESLLFESASTTQIGFLDCDLHRCNMMSLTLIRFTWCLVVDL